MTLPCFGIQAVGVQKAGFFKSPTQWVLLDLGFLGLLWGYLDEHCNKY